MRFMELDFTQPAPKPGTLKECHKLIEVLWAALAKLSDDVNQLRQENIFLKETVAALEEKLNSNSKNSSKPPVQ